MISNTKLHLFHPFRLVILFLLLNIARGSSSNVKKAEEGELAEQYSPFLITEKVLSATRHDCHENGVVASWCGRKANYDYINPNNLDLTDCSIHPTLDIYMCGCPNDPKACPLECVQGSELVSQRPHMIQCRGLPHDEPNYILKTPKDKLAPPDVDHQHCENNALVASWCHEEPAADAKKKHELDCLLLPALDEYVCNCHDNPAACPDDCVGGQPPDKKTKHSIRCKGIPVDQPNYVLLQEKRKKK